ncbi:hypothetical protein M5689_023527 [Euphorbia peplus]|nr:hypothetical protein M5689_023527 [Euphorbia peplus]
MFRSLTLSFKHGFENIEIVVDNVKLYNVHLESEVLLKDIRLDRLRRKVDLIQRVINVKVEKQSNQVDKILTTHEFNRSADLLADHAKLDFLEVLYHLPADIEDVMQYDLARTRISGPDLDI